MVTGIINIYKEKGFTSFDVVAKMRGIFHQKKIGHTGTLDPDAEGVLPVCLGKATRVCDMLTDKDKEYRAVLLLGKMTTTQDISGEILKEAEVDVTKEQVVETIKSFIGESEQIPPMYSALKVNGQKLVDLARKGITVERKARPITIYDIKIEKVDLPRVEMTVSCSKGTYIRTICNDIGEKLGCYGCMESLVRTKAAGFKIENAIKLSDLEKIVQNNEASKVINPIDSVLGGFPKIVASENAQKFVRNGNKLIMEEISFEDNRSVNLEDETIQYRLYDYKGDFIGIYRFLTETKEFKPVKLFME